MSRRRFPGSYLVGTGRTVHHGRHEGNPTEGGKRERRQYPGPRRLSEVIRGWTGSCDPWFPNRDLGTPMLEIHHVLSNDDRTTPGGQDTHQSRLRTPVLWWQEHFCLLVSNRDGRNFQ